MKKSKELEPPGIPYFFLNMLIRKDMKIFLLGDFDEEYLEIAATSGRRQANIWYWKHFFRSIPKIFVDTVRWRIEMFRNYLIIALRNMKRQKTFSLLNILGLSIALMVCLWIYLFIKDEFSFDHSHKNGDAIYSVVKTDHHFNNMRRYIEVSTGPAIKEFFPEIEYSVRFTHYNVIVRREDRLFQELCDFTDRDFFKMFSFGLIYGNEEYVLDSLGSVVLTESLARKYFGHGDPVGKTLTISFGNIEGDYIVSGVAEDVPSNSFLQFKMLMNIKELNKIYGPDVLANRNWSLAYTFIQLKKGISPQTIEERLPTFFEQNFAPLIEERKNRGSWNEEGATITLWLQNLKDIYLHSQGIEGPGESQVSKSYILGAMGLLILFIACINFTNLAIGRASTRTVEIGIRKILGARRRDLIRQFWSESIMIVFFSMLAALTAGLLLLPLFNRLANKNILESDILNVSNLALFGAATVLVGILAGLYPGVILSRIQPVRIIRGVFKFGGKTLLTRLLVIAQFSVAIFLIISTLTLSKQVRYILDKDMGYDREGVVVINTFERRDFEVNEHIFNIFEAEAESLPYIKSVSGCVFPLSSEMGEGKLTFNDKRLDFSFTSVHYNFFATMGIKFVAGTDFPRQLSDESEPIIVTESFVKAFEIENPIGTMIDMNTQIVGVVKDFHFWNLKEKIRPTIITLDRRSGPRNLLVRIDTSDINSAVAGLGSIWKKVQPNKPFDFAFEDDIFQKKYSEERRWSKITFFSSFFAILISCMGLIGITTLATGRRIKEIGIRKVLGASVTKICSLLAREYLLLVAVSNFIAWPLGYFFMSKWLNGYAYRTEIDAGIFILAGLLTLIVSTATIGTLSFKAASTNPVDSLRFE
jgi:putative ABC transport system permease protein